MAAGGSDLQRALRHLLPLDLGKVGQHGHAGQRLSNDAPGLRDLKGRQAIECAGEFVQVAGADHLDALDQRGFLGVTGRHDDALELLVAGKRGGRQDAAHMPDAAIQRQLADNHRAIEATEVELLGGHQQAERDGQVVAGADLAQVCRREADGDTVGGEVQAAVADGGADALTALFDGGIGQADEGEGGQAAAAVDLDFDDVAFQTEDGARIHLGEHGCRRW